MYDRLPPQDIDAEMAILGAMMVDPEAVMVVLPKLQPSDFYREKNRWAFEACANLSSQGVQINQITVMSYLRERQLLDEMGGWQFFQQCVESIPNSIGVEDWVDTVKKCSIRRQLIIAGGKICGLAYEESGSIDDVLSESNALLHQVQATTTSNGPVSIKHIADEYYGAISDAGKPLPDHGIKTGFYDLDRMTGGLQPEDLIIIAARPGMGKTSLAVNIAQKVSRTKNVLMFSLEMSKDSLFRRILGAVAMVPSQQLRNNWLNEYDRERVIHQLGKISELGFYIDDTGGISLPTMRHRVTQLDNTLRCMPESESGVDLIIVDYLQLMTHQGRNRVEEIGELSKGLKELAKMVHVPVVCLSQLNRAVESRPDKRPILSDLRDGGSIEQDADLVLFITREDMYWDLEKWTASFPTKPYPANLAIIDIAKHRNGPTGEFKLTYRKEATTFESLAGS